MSIAKLIADRTGAIPATTQIGNRLVWLQPRPKSNPCPGRVPGLKAHKTAHARTQRRFKIHETTVATAQHQPAVCRIIVHRKITLSATTLSKTAQTGTAAVVQVVVDQVVIDQVVIGQVVAGQAVVGQVVIEKENREAISAP